MKKIPNRRGPQAKIGDTVHITSDDGRIIVGEVVSFVEGFKNWIKEVQVKGKDGYTTIEVKDLLVELVQIIQDISKSKFWVWFTNLFRKKKKKKS